MYRWTDGDAVVRHQLSYGCRRKDYEDRGAVHVDEAARNNGVVQGNIGCDSGCPAGGDNRQCFYGNDGGNLWRL